jgi:hypothetical protein
MYTQFSFEELQRCCIFKFGFLAFHFSADKYNKFSWNCAFLGTLNYPLLRNSWLCFLAVASSVGA